MVNKEAAQKHKAAGNSAFTAGKYDEAVKSFTDAIENDPTDHVLYSNRSGAHAMKDNYTAAFSDAEECIKLNPKWAKGYSRKGLALFKMGKIQAAVQAYNQGIEIDPDNQQLKEGLAQARSGMLMEMVEENFKMRITELLTKPKFQQYAREDPTFQEQLLAAAREMFMSSTGSNDPTGLRSMMMPRHVNPAVQEALSEMFGNSPEEEEAEREKRSSEMSSARKHREEKEKKMEEDARLAARPTNEVEAENRKKEGNELYKAKKFQEAIEAYDKAHALNPKDLLILNNKAAVLLEMGESERCIAQCEEALEKRVEIKAPFSVVAKIYSRMAVCYTRTKQFDLAIAMYRKSLTEDNNRHTRAALKDVERMKEKIEKEAFLDPAKAEEHRVKGNEFYKNQDYVNAKKEYDEAIQRNPDDVRLYSNRAAVYSNLLEYPSALKDAEKALELDPQFVKGWSRKGTVHFFMKNYNKARDAYKRGLDIDPDNTECRQGLEKTMHRIIETQRSGEVDEQQVKQAMSDPEIQAIMMDPQFQLILKQMQENPASAQEALKDPKVREGIEKLITAGILKLG